MARPPQFERPDDALTRDLVAVKVAAKHLSPGDRAHLIAWLLLYYHDNGAMFSPQISRPPTTDRDRRCRVLARARPKRPQGERRLEDR